MSSEMPPEVPPPVQAEPETAAAQEVRAAEAAAIRRRWITLGEVLAVVAVLISGLTLWNSYEQRRTDEEDRRTERSVAAKKDSRIGLIATGASGDSLTFKGVNCSLQSSEIRFPKALGVADQSTVLTHRIDANWFEGAMLKLNDASPDLRSGRLPVVIESQCEAEDGPRTETAIYDIAWRIESRFLRGRTLRLDGLVRREAVSGDGRARLDRMWTGAKKS